MKKIGVLITHGIGDQQSDFADGLIRELKKRFGEHVEEMSGGKITDGKDYLIPKTVWWGPIASQRQSEFLNRAHATGKVADDAVHRMFATMAGDLIAYMQSKDDGKFADPRAAATGFYGKVQELFGAMAAELYEEVGLSGQISLVAHSLGTIMALDWLKYRNSYVPVKNLFLIGSPKAVANLGYGDYGAPGFDKLPGKFWNFLDRDDMVGWPLRGTLNSKWDAVVDEDIEVNVGSPLKSWNAASHTEYWTDNNFTKPVARLLAEQFMESSSSPAVEKPAA